MDPEKLVGLTLDEATRTCAEAGFRARLRKEDGKAFIGTADYRRDRVNFEVENGVVVRAYVG